MSQAFCSACAVTYSRNATHLWEPLARLVLEASYEACLASACGNAARHGGGGASGRCFLTCVGGGVFGNDLAWIADAIDAAMTRFANRGLDAVLVCYSEYDLAPCLRRVVRKFDVPASDRER